MYGYIRPDKGELRVREFQQFRSVYCGLCETLRDRYGVISRFAVNYDMAFLAMVLLSEDSVSQLRRCPIHPLSKRSCVLGCEAMEAAADYSVILGWWKLRDNARDEKALKSLASASGSLAFKRAYEKAAVFRPEFDANARECLTELSRLEEEKCSSLDRCADCFARILSFVGQDRDSEQSRICRELFYHVGRCVYILDAVDDLADDIRENSYNPLRYRFSLEGDRLTDEQKQEVRASLNLSQRSACAALSLRNNDKWQPILENIITVGLPQVTELVFSGKWNKQEKKGGREPRIEEQII